MGHSILPSGRGSSEQLLGRHGFSDLRTTAQAGDFGRVKLLTDKFKSSAVLARALPFVVFLVLTFAQGQLGEASRYWVYLLKTLVGAWLVWLMRPYVAEMKWALSWEAVLAGVGVCIIWVGIDSLYPHSNELFAKLGVAKVKAAVIWNPHVVFGRNTALAWLFIVVRILGSSVVVPPLEEVFFRSFLYRYIAKADFESVPLGPFLAMPFVVTSVLFGFEHDQWLAGILCGFAYQGLVCWKKRLGDAIAAHGITNLLLGLYVVYRGAWQFW